MRTANQSVERHPENKSLVMGVGISAGKVIILTVGTLTPTPSLFLSRIGRIIMIVCDDY